MAKIDLSLIPGSPNLGNQIDFSKIPKSQANPIDAANVLGSPDFQSNSPQYNNAIPPMQSDNFLGRFGEALSYFPKGVYETAKGLGKGAVQGSVNLENMARDTVRSTGLSDRQNVQMPQWTQPQGQIQGAFEPIGEAIPAMAAMAALPEAGAAGLAAKIAQFVGKSALGTGLVTGSTEGRLPTGTELGSYGALDLLLEGLGSRGIKLFKKAFNGDRTAEKKLIKNFGVTTGDIAQELGVKAGSAKSIEKQQQKLATDLYNKIKSVSSKAFNAKKKDFERVAKSVADDVLGKLPNSEIKTKQTNAIIKKIMQYAPEKGTANGEHMVAIIEKLNQGLYGKGTRSVLTPKQISSVENAFKNKVKDLLPKNVRPMYEELAKRLEVASSMRNAKVEQMLKKVGIGAATGGTVGGAMSISQGQSPADIALNTLKGSLLGTGLSALNKGTMQNTRFLTTTGKALSKAKSSPVKTLAKFGVQELLRKFGLK